MNNTGKKPRLGSIPICHGMRVWYSLLVLILVAGGVSAGITADFAGVPTSGPEPLTVSFIDQSSSNQLITGHLWNFGDASSNSTEQNPNHTYQGRGRYNVSLTVTNAIGENNTLTESAYIHVMPSDYPVVRFTASPLNCSTSQTVSFFDQSDLDPAVPDEMYTYVWDFGDGSNDITNTRNPRHSYSSSGEYAATLQIQDQNGAKHNSPVPVQITVDNRSAFSARFTAIPPSGSVPLAVSFVDQSISPVPVTSYLWNFGDGSKNSTDQNPVHTYLGTGKYNVTLSIVDADGAQVNTTRSAYIHAQPSEYPAVKFTAVPQNGTAPELIYFIDQSELDPAVPDEMYTYIWDFGDNSTPDASNNRNVGHTYTTPGEYTAMLQIQDQHGARYNSPAPVSLVITNSSSPFSASFAAEPRTGSPPLRVSFTDRSISPVSITNYFWNFGDGSAPSTEKNPVHSYLGPGTYTVSLTIRDANGNNAIGSEPAYIDVRPSPYPVVKYKATPETGQAPLSVLFVDESELDPALPKEKYRYIWNFGDGSSPFHSKGKAVRHRYLKPGTYATSLQVQDSNRVIYNSTVPVLIKVTSKTPPLMASFTATPLSGPAPHTVSFTDTSAGTDPRTAYRWDFGDGSPFSTEKDPVHTYHRPGTYPVTMSISGPQGSDTLKRDRYINVTSPSTHCITASSSEHGSITPSGSVIVQDGADQSFSITPDSGFIIRDVLVDGKSVGVVSTHTFSKVRTDHTISASFTAQSQPLIADFSMDKGSGTVPLMVQFTDTSLGSPNSWYWSFGDGSDTMKQNPVHTYSGSGQFPVVLTVRNGSGVYDESKVKYVIVIS